MLKVIEKSTNLQTTRSPGSKIFVNKKPDNTLSVSGGVQREVLISKEKPERVLIGSLSPKNTVTIKHAPENKLVAVNAGVVYKTINGEEAQTAVANGQVLLNQIVFAGVGGTCRVASSSDPEAMFLPIFVAGNSAADGETVKLKRIDQEHLTAGVLVPGEPVFLGLSGTVSHTAAGVVSMALGVATGVNKFFGRAGQRVRISN